MSPRPLALSLLVGLAAARAEAFDLSFWEQELRLELTETLDAAYHGDNDLNQDPLDPEDHEADDRYGHLFNTLDARLSWNDWTLGGRFDIFSFIDAPAPPATKTQVPRSYQSRYEDQIILEKIHLSLSRPAFDLHLGDFHASFGRGLALHVAASDELAVDTTIRGGRLTAHWGRTGWTLLAGQFNPLNVDQVTGYVVRDPDEVVLGTRLERALLDALHLGLHGVYILNDTERPGFDFEGPNDNLVGGASLELLGLFSRLDLYMELDVQRTRLSGRVIRGPDAEQNPVLPVDVDSGLAAYGTATTSLGPVILLTEAAYYDGFELKAVFPSRSLSGAPYPSSPREVLYHRPPTLDRIDVLVEDNTRLWGLRGRMDWSIDELALGTTRLGALTLYANYSYFHNWFAAPVRIQHPFFGLEWSWDDPGGHLFASFGRRWTTNRDNAEPIKHTWQTDGSLEQQLPLRLTASIAGIYRSSRASMPAGTIGWSELDLTASLRWSSRLALSGTYEFSDEFQQDPAVPRHYLSGVAKVMVTDSSYLRLLVGQTRGGLKCIAGVCRIYPPFTGVQLTAVVRL